MRQCAHCGHQQSGLRSDFVMTSGAHAAIPVPLRLVESCSVLSAVVKILLVSDLVAHVAVVGQAYQGVRVAIRNWFPVPSPPPLSSFPAPLQPRAPSHAVSQRAGYEAARSASCSCSGTGVPGQAGCCRPQGPCFFPKMCCYA